MDTMKGKATVLLGGVVGVFGVYLIARQRAKSKKKMNKKKLLAVFSAVAEDMQGTVMEIVKQEKQIRTNAAQSGHQISDAEM